MPIEVRVGNRREHCLDQAVAHHREAHGFSSHLLRGNLGRARPSLQLRQLSLRASHVRLSCFHGLLGSGNLIGWCTCFEKIVVRLGHLERSLRRRGRLLRLSQLGLEQRIVDLNDHLPGLHGIPLFGKDLQHTTAYFRRDHHIRRFDCPGRGQRRRLCGRVCRPHIACSN